MKLSISCTRYITYDNRLSIEIQIANKNLISTEEYKQILDHIKGIRRIVYPKFYELKEKKYKKGKE